MSVTDRLGAEKGRGNATTGDSLSSDDASCALVDGNLSPSRVPDDSTERGNEHEGWCREVLDALPAAVYTTDAAGRITYYNQAAADLAGRRPELGKDEWCVTWRLYWPDGTPLPHDQCPMAAALKENRPIRGVEAILERPDGTRTAFLPFPTPMRDASGALVGAVNMLVDIDERKRTDAALAEETQSLRTLNRVGALLAAELDLDRLVQAVTDAGTELTGAQFGAFFYNVLDAQGESYTLSGRPREAFARFPMPRNTQVFAPTFHGDGIVRSDDITKDPRYGQSAPYHGMPEGHLPVRSYLAVPVVSRSGEVLGGLFFGHQRVGVFTDRAEQLVEGIAAQAAIAIDNARLYQAAQREIAERKRAQDELRTLNETLEERVAERTAALEEANRRLLREAEEKRQAEAALHQAQKMEAIGQLTGGVAHDFNNLLTSVLGNLELLDARLRDEKLRKLANNAARAAQRGASLTRQLLAYARRQHLVQQPVDANAVIVGMDEMLTRSLGGLAHIETDLVDDLWHASTDPTQLELVVLNLAINARDAMPLGGTLRVETRNVRGGDPMLPPELAPGDYVRIAVTDTGTGMLPEVLARALEPFYTTKGIGKGSGLGLSQVYGVATQSGGTVRLRSTLDVGTTVEIFLPRVDRVGGADEGPAAVDRVARSHVHSTVLVVDDDDDVRELAVSFLENGGYRVVEARSGPAALAALGSSDGETVDLALVDFAMPGTSGTEFVHLARQRRPDLPVVYVTGYADPNGRTALTEDEMSVSKPYRSADLLNAVEQALRRSVRSSASKVIKLRSNARP